MSESDYLIKLLCENGYKITIQRSMIYEILMENKDKHLSTEEIYELVTSS